MRECLKPVLEDHRGLAAAVDHFTGQPSRRHHPTFHEFQELDQIAGIIHAASARFLDGTDAAERELRVKLERLEDHSRSSCSRIVLMRPLELAGISGLYLHELLDFVKAGCFVYELDPHGRLWFRASAVRPVVLEIMLALGGSGRA